MLLQILYNSKGLSKTAALAAILRARPNRDTGQLISYAPEVQVGEVSRY